MSVPSSRRKESSFAGYHVFYELRAEVTDLIFRDFGFSEEKYREMIERFRNAHASAPNVDKQVEKYEVRLRNFVDWFVDDEKKEILNILRKIGGEFTAGNSIYPSENEARIDEYIQRRRHINESIAQCYVLKQEINYVIGTLPVDINKFKRFDEKISQLIGIYKGVRKADNRFIRSPLTGKEKKNYFTPVKPVIIREGSKYNNKGHQESARSGYNSSFAAEYSRDVESGEILDRYLEDFDKREQEQKEHEIRRAKVEADIKRAQQEEEAKFYNSMQKQIAQPQQHENHNQSSAQQQQSNQDIKIPQPSEPLPPPKYPSLYEQKQQAKIERQNQRYNQQYQQRVPNTSKMNNQGFKR